MPPQQQNAQRGVCHHSACSFGRHTHHMVLEPWATRDFHIGEGEAYPLAVVDGPLAVHCPLHRQDSLCATMHPWQNKWSSPRVCSPGRRKHLNSSVLIFPTVGSRCSPRRSRARRHRPRTVSACCCRGGAHCGAGRCRRSCPRTRPMRAPRPPKSSCPTAWGTYSSTTRCWWKPASRSTIRHS